MAFQVVPLFTFTLFLLTFLPLISSRPNSAHSHQNEPSSSMFLNHLQGRRKGDKVEGIHQLKKYLQHFGYLNNNIQVQTQSESNDNEFDDRLDYAIRTYQKNYNLKPTGILDAKTLAQMSKPRCGVADIIDGKTWMSSGKNGSDNFHAVPQFAFFEGNPKWPAEKSHLTYGFLPGTPSEAISPVARALATWASNSHFTFSQASAVESADIKITFARGNHGDNAPFDGAGGVLAHAFTPPDGRLHYDADESWAVGAVDGSFDIETVALHEIGHLLGLQHSSVEGAIMWPSISEGMTKGLGADDIEGIKTLYNNIA